MPLDKPELAAKYGVQRTIPNTREPLDASDDLAATATGGYDLRGKWVYLVAEADIEVLRADVSGGGFPMATGAVEEFFVPTDGGSTVIEHTGTDGQLVALFDSDQG